MGLVGSGEVVNTKYNPARASGKREHGRRARLPTPTKSYLHWDVGTLRDLIDATADALEEPMVTVRVRANTLRKAGMITTGGRGLNAPQMGPTDATNLLLASLSGSPSTQSDRVTEELRSLRPFPSGKTELSPRERADEEAVLAHYGRIPKDLGDALGLVFERILTQQFVQLISQPLQGITVTVERGEGRQASILIEHPDGSRSFRLFVPKGAKLGGPIRTFLQFKRNVRETCWTGALWRIAQAIRLAERSGNDTSRVRSIP